MAPITRSQTRKELNDVKFSLYGSAVLARLTKMKEAKPLLDLFEGTDDSPQSTVYEKFLEAADNIRATLSEARGLQGIGDVLFKASSELRGHIRKNTSPTQDTSAFIKAWREEGDGLDDDQTPSANLI
jgi:hypothetical protein